jgi:ABC-type arginine transport system ATPase subunit
MKSPTVFSNLNAQELISSKATVTTINTAGAVTLTAAQVAGGLILRDPNGAGRADLVPTVAALYTEIGSPLKIAGLSFDFTIRNTADAAETITVTTNTGWTLSGTMTIGQNNSKTFRVVFDTAAAATLYSLGTVVH